MKDIPTLPYTSTCEIPSLLYTWSLKKVPLLGGASLYLTIILRNCAEYRLILSRQGRRPSRLKSDDIPQIEQYNCFIIQQIDNKTARKVFKSLCRHYFTSFSSHVRSYVYRRISVTYRWQISRASWPYLDSVTICWIIKAIIGSIPPGTMYTYHEQFI